MLSSPLSSPHALACCLCPAWPCHGAWRKTADRRANGAHRQRCRLSPRASAAALYCGVSDGDACLHEQRGAAAFFLRARGNARAWRRLIPAGIFSCWLSAHGRDAGGTGYSLYQRPAAALTWAKSSACCHAFLDGTSFLKRSSTVRAAARFCWCRKTTRRLHTRCPTTHAFRWRLHLPSCLRLRCAATC